VRCPTGTILHGENEVFQRNRNDFPKENGLGGYFQQTNFFFFFFLRARSTTPLKYFTGVFGRWRDHARFLTFTALMNR
jgi:hypothetical protein